jgi:hypothetical protein
MYPGLRRKMERMAPLFPEELVADCEYVKSLGIEQVRAYSFGDFHPDDVPLLKILTQHFRTYLFSKTLTLHLKSLVELANLPNLWISLSFNRNFMKTFEKMRDLVLKHCMMNVAFNYTFLRDEEYFNSPNFQVFFDVNDRKKNAKEEKLKVIPERKLCFDTCLTCSKCDVGFIECTVGESYSVAA